MIEVEMNKDIREYTPKFIGLFTLKQCISLVVSAAVAGITYSIVHPYTTSDVAASVSACTTIPILIFGGFVHPYKGMEMTTYVQLMLRFLLAPKLRLKTKKVKGVDKDMRPTEKKRKRMRKKESTKGTY